MSRSATGAVDPDTCKLIGKSRPKQIWDPAAHHKTWNNINWKSRGPAGPHSTLQVSTETVFQCMACARINLEWLVKIFDWTNHLAFGVCLFSSDKEIIRLCRWWGLVTPAQEPASLQSPMFVPANPFIHSSICHSKSFPLNPFFLNCNNNHVCFAILWLSAM